METEKNSVECSANLICEEQGMNYITLFDDFLEDHFLDLTEEEVGKITLAALRYVKSGDEPDYEPRTVLSLTWRRIKRHIDQCNAKVEKNKANGSKPKRTEANGSERKRTEAKASEPKRTEANRSEPVYEQEQEQEQEYAQEYAQEQEHKGTVTRSRSSRFTAPTVDEVKAYCQERQNKVDPQKFVDYYTANGWRVGKNPMKDWRACVRTWEKNGYDGRDSPGDKGVGYGQILRQREYDDDYFASLEVDLTK